MQNFHQQIKKIAKNIEKELNKELNKTSIKVKYSTEGQDMGFNYLDKESEKTLKELLANENYYNCPCFIVPSNYSASVIENLIDLGYLTSKEGVTYYNDGSFVRGARLTQKAKTYDELKRQYEERNSYTTYNDFRNANLSNSNNQVGNVNSNQNVTITNELVDEILKEISEKIETYGLSDDNKQELKDLVDDVKEKQQKKPNLVKRGLKAIWDFAKDVGCGVLAAYISNKCGF